MIIRGDALKIPLADESVDLIVTSPPYWALRSYRDGGEHYDNQLGSEETPQAWLEAMWAVMDECWRVLKPTGSAFFNLGDKYAGSGGHNNNGLGKSTLNGHGGTGTTRDRGIKETTATRRNAPDRYNQNSDGIRPKSLMALPWRFAIGCIDRGWILRRDICWHKLNGLPESTQDRCRSSHEYVFHLTKQGRYFSAIDEIREPHARLWEAGNQNGHTCVGNYLREHLAAGHGGNTGIQQTAPNPLGKLPGSVWSIPSEPLIPEEGDTTWLGKIGLCQRCNKLKMAAGFGEEQLTEPGIPTITSPTEENASPIDSLMKSGSAPFPKGSQSITSAETEPASTQSISKQSPSPSMSGEETTSSSSTPERPNASTDIHSAKKILTGKVELVIAERVGLCDCATTGPDSKPGSVWSIPSEPLVIPQWAKDKYNLPDHFAAFPQEIPRRIILGWSPNGICTVCEQGRRPVLAKALRITGAATGKTKSHDLLRDNINNGGWDQTGYPLGATEATITGYACACSDDKSPTRPAIVLDPFGGTGTTALVAEALGRKAISLDLSADYCRLAKWRCSQPATKVLSRTWRDRQGALL